MILKEDNLIRIYRKSNGVCAMCGSIYNLHVTKFIPEWTRVDNDLANSILLCDKCIEKRGYNFIQLNNLNYITKVAKAELMLYYRTYRNYLRKYIQLYGEYRTSGKLNVSTTILTLKSYDEYIVEEGLENAL